jgi:phosphatidate cytidylyltransferase
MLIPRVITAVVGLPIVFAVFKWGSYWLIAGVFTLLVLLTAFEAGKMLFGTLDETSLVRRRILTLTAMAFVFGLYFFLALSPIERSIELGFLLFFAAVCTGAFIDPVPSRSVKVAGLFMLTVTYAALPWIFITDLYLRGTRGVWLALLLIIVWSNDTFAYFGGRAFGRRKLAPGISPNKTIEGSVAGLLGGLAAAFIFNFYVPTEEPIEGPRLVACAILAGTAGQLGDLFESMLKRYSHVKDSGKIFPGHGGLLDRVDGLLFAAPVLWFLLVI